MPLKILWIFTLKKKVKKVIEFAYNISHSKYKDIKTNKDYLVIKLLYPYIIPFII